MPITHQTERRKSNGDRAEQANQLDEVLLKAGALQNAIFASAHFSCIATDEKGVIQLFNVGAERMLGYTAAEVINKITPADLHDPQEVIERARSLSLELGTPIAPGCDALVFKAARGIEDIYELTKIRKDGSRFPATISVTALRDDQAGIIGYLLIGTDNTARQQVEGERKKALRDLNDMKEALNKHALVAITDTQGKITYVNDKFCVISQYSREELLGKDHRIINSGHHSKEFFRNLWMTIAQGKAWHGEIKNKAKDGSTYWVETTIVPFLDEQGKPRQYMAIRADITERKSAEEASAQLAAIVNSSNDAIIGKDLKGVVISWNIGAERIFGYAANEIVGTSIVRLLPPDRQEEELNIMNRIKKGESVEHFETLRVAKDGHLVDVSVSVSPIKDKTGKIVGASKMAQDISARKQADEARRLSETRYRTLFDYAPDGIVIADPRSYYLDANASMCRMLGYTRDELIGKHASDIVAPEEIPHISRALGIIRADAGYQREWLFRRKDGSKFEAEVIATAMPDGNLMGMVRDIAERKRTMEALVESENRLRFVTDNARVGLVIVDRDRRYTYANNAYAEVLDLPESAIVGQRVSEVLPRIYEEQIRPQLDRAFAGTRVAYELRKPESGGDRHFAIKYEPTRVEGEVTLVIVVVTDITEIKRAEEAQRATEARYRALFDYAPIGIVIADTEGYWLDANASMCRMLGYTYDELIGMHASKIVSPEDIPNIEPSLSKVKAKLDHHREGRFRRRDGSIFPTEIHATLMPDGNMVGMIRDISERKLAEETLRRQAALIDLSPDAIIVLDLDGKIISWSRGAEALYGWTKEEVIGQVTHSLLKTCFSEPLENIMGQFEKTGRWSGELVHHTKEGLLVNVRSWWLAEYDALGNRIGMLESNIDNTERKLAEDKFHQLNAELEARVVERTAELEAANKELEAFSYSVSHDLRAPLRAVDGFSQAVLEDYGPLLPPDGQRYLKTIREGAQQMGILIDDLLAFSRLSRAPINKQTVDTTKLVRAVLEDLNSDRQGRQVEIRENELPTCLADPALLKQVWANLLSNALKYTRGRTPAEIEIGCNRGRENVYFVRDNGAGFDMRYVHKLFGVFQRLHRVDQFEGTGVGLAIVQRIIHRHGGRIWAEASVNKGATFYFTLNEDANL